MAALSAGKQVDRKEPVLIAHKVAASTAIYQGALVKVSAAGLLAPQAAEAGGHNAGVAYEDMDNASGAAGDKECRVYKSGVFLLEGAAFTQADVGSTVYASDDQTVSTTQGVNEIAVGKIVEYESATKVWVRIEAQV